MTANQTQHRTWTSASPAFYVRELPGDLTDDEKLALAAVLVECKVLRSAS